MISIYARQLIGSDSWFVSQTRKRVTHSASNITCGHCPPSGGIITNRGDTTIHRSEIDEYVRWVLSKRLRTVKKLGLQMSH